MNVFALTIELSERNGWARYSLDLTRALENAGVGVHVAIHSADSHKTKHPHTVCLPNTDNYVKNILFSFWYAWRLRKHAAAADVIHCYVERYSFIAYWLSKLAGKKYIVTTHGTYGVLPYHMSPLVRSFHHKTLRSAHRVVCVSNYTKKLLEARGLTNLEVINNGITYSQFASQGDEATEREDLVLSVGALKHRKGQHISLEAFAHIADEFPHARYCIVGDKSDSAYFQSLQNIVAEYGLEERVQFLSSIPEAELHDLYRRAKVFVLTSISKGAHFEGFGLVYLEANANGVPVVGTLNSGAEDAIQDGETGFLVPQEDVEATTTAMRKLLSDSATWSSMSEEARVWAEKHDWSTISTEYLKLYTASQMN